MTKHLPQDKNTTFFELEIPDRLEIQEDHGISSSKMYNFCLLFTTSSTMAVKDLEITVFEITPLLMDGIGCRFFYSLQNRI